MKRGVQYIRAQPWRAAPILGVWLAAHALLALPLPQWAQGGAALALLLFPGALLALLVFADEQDAVARMWMALCGALAFIPPLMLLIHILPGVPPRWLPLLLADLLTILHGVLLLRATNAERATRDQAQARLAWRARLLQPSTLLILILLLGAAFRAPFLGASEMQGDESLVLMLANGIVHGRDDILLAHKKGPVEVLLTTPAFVITGRISEGVARLPFLLAGMSIVLGAFVLGRSLFATDEAGARGSAVGLLAATIVALDGYLVGFARIIQYQSIVVLMTAASVWCAWRFAQGDQHPRRYLQCAAIFAAVGLLAHWDAVFVLPVLAWLAFAGVRRAHMSAGQAARALLPPTLLGALMLAAFYIPFVTNEHFTRTLGYLALRVKYKSGNTFPFNNLLTYYDTATFYNTVFQMRTYMAVLFSGLVAWLWRYLRPRWLGGLVALLLIAGATLLERDAAALQLPQGGSLMGAFVALPLAALLLAPATPLALRTGLLWFSIPLCVEAFVVSFPNTHFYSMDTPAALLIALAVVRLWYWLSKVRVRWLQAPLALAGTALLLLAAPYMYIAFVRQSPPYNLAFPRGRPEIYRAGYGDKKPDSGKFGFPHKSGWKVIGSLYQQGVLRGSYVSNEVEKITGWYTRGTYRCAESPDYYFIAKMPNDSVNIATKSLRKYHLFGSVLLNGSDEIKIYSRQPVAAPQTFDASIYAPLFDAQPVSNFPISSSMRDSLPQQVFDTRWQYGLRLYGYDLDRTLLTADQNAVMTLYWQVDESLPHNYQVVLQVLDHTSTPIQDSIQSYCYVVPPKEWDKDQVNKSSFQIKMNEHTPPGTYTLRVGLRDRKSGAWLPLADGAQMLTLPNALVVK